MESGKVVRSTVSEVPARGRDTMGVIFAKPAVSDAIVGVAHNAEREIEKTVDAEAQEGHGAAPDGGEAATAAPEADDHATDDSTVALEPNDNGGDA